MNIEWYHYLGTENESVKISNSFEIGQGPGFPYSFKSYLVSLVFEENFKALSSRKPLKFSFYAADSVGGSDV